MFTCFRQEIDCLARQTGLEKTHENGLFWCIYCLVDSKGSSIQPRLPTYCHDGLLGIQISKEKVHEFFLPQILKTLLTELILNMVLRDASASKKLDQNCCSISKYFHARSYPMKFNIRYHYYRIFFKTNVLNQPRRTRHRSASSWRSKTCHGWAKSLLTKLLIRWLPKLESLLSGIVLECV